MCHVNRTEGGLNMATSGGRLRGPTEFVLLGEILQKFAFVLEAFWTVCLGAFCEERVRCCVSGLWVWSVVGLDCSFFFFFLNNDSLSSFLVIVIVISTVNISTRIITIIFIIFISPPPPKSSSLLCYDHHLYRHYPPTILIITITILIAIMTIIAVYLFHSFFHGGSIRFRVIPRPVNGVFMDIF